MKKTILLFSIVTVTVFNIQAQCNGDVYIPDVNFKNYLLNNSSINTDNNNQISCAEATNFNGSINVNASGIVNLTGIETFVNLRALSCSSNNLTTLDVSNNLSL